MTTRRELLTGAAKALAAGPFLGLRSTRAQSPRVRRDVTRMDIRDPFFSKYADAVQMMHDLPDDDPRNWRRQAIIHADHCVHGRIGFLEWHRFYITYFEQICGELIGDSSFALPYWNWTHDRGLLPEPFFGDNPLNVRYWDDPSDYRSPLWGRISTVGARQLSATEGLQDNDSFSELVTESYIESIRRQSVYRRFRRMLESSPHGAVHVMTGGVNGHMSSGLSPLDPVFWLHHCNVDRIWAEWQAAGNDTTAIPATFPEQFVDQFGENVAANANESHDHLSMGFTYDSLAGSGLTLLGADDIPDESAADRLAVSDSEALIGRLISDEISLVDTASNLRVPTAGLASEMFGSRVFRATSLLESPRNAVEPSRFLAELRGVSSPSRDEPPLIVNVFLECPYLTPQTPSTDPHYAGAFSFFGQSMPNMSDGVDFIVDVTRPLRFLAEQGRLRPDELNVQLMPLAVTEGGAPDAEFLVSSVEVYRV